MARLILLASVSSAFRIKKHNPTAPVRCGDYFTACDGYDTSDCYLPTVPTEDVVASCNADLHQSFRNFASAPIGSNSKREYMLGGMAGQNGAPTCRTGLMYNSIGGTTDSCPVPLPPSTEDIKATDDSFHIFTIGDWGPTEVGDCWWKCKGVARCSASMWIYTDKTQCPPEGSPEWNEVENAQTDVIDQMGKFGEKENPVAVINVGDNFYFGGIGFPEQHPGGLSSMSLDFAFRTTWSDRYFKYDALKVPWISCLGNHDYGGAGCLTDWMAQIDYTKQDKTKNWIMPALWYKQRISAPTYDVDIFVSEINHDDAKVKNHHGICYQPLCKTGVKSNETACENRFDAVLQANLKWLEFALEQSSARWKILVGHFITGAATEMFLSVAGKHGVNLFVAGHMHDQQIYEVGCCEGKGRFCGHESCSMTRILTGGGGGIGLTGEYFGFYSLLFTANNITIKMIDNHGTRIAPQSGSLAHPSPI